MGFPMIRAGVAVLIGVVPVFADVPLVVEMVSADLVSYERDYLLTGEIVPRDSLSVSFRSGGRVSRVEVAEGDVVAAGAVLARMEAVQFEQALRAAQAGVSTASADRDQAIEDLQRQESLLERGATTRISRDNAADALRVAEGALVQAQADLDRARKAMDDTVLTAPSAATVTDRLVEPGQVVGAAQPVVELALGTTLDALFDVPEVMLTVPSTGHRVELTPMNDPSAEVFYGEARVVSPLVNPATGAVAVTLSVEGASDSVQYGDAVRGLVRQMDPPAIALPHTALSATADGPAVWVVDPDSMAVSLQQITVDRYETGRVVLADGIEVGTLVVTRGAHLMYPGRIVQAAKGAGQ